MFIGVYTDCYRNIHVYAGKSIDEIMKQADEDHHDFDGFEFYKGKPIKVEYTRSYTVKEEV